MHILELICLGFLALIILMPIIDPDVEIKEQSEQNEGDKS